MSSQFRKWDLRNFFGKQAKLANDRSPHGGSDSSLPIGCRKRGSAFCSCPLCGVQFPLHRIQMHAANCNGKVNTSKSNQALVNEKTTPKSNYIDDKTCMEGAKSNKSKCDPRNSGGIAKFNPPEDVFIQRQVATSKRGNLLVKIKPTSAPIPGLYIYENFITEAEEDQILKTLDDATRRDYLPWKPSNFNGAHFGKRWGVHCNLRTRQVTPAEHELPWFMKDILIPKLQALNLPEMMRVAWIPNEANAIDYRRKEQHVLHSHVDNRHLSKESIANLSLAGDCYMTFRQEKPQQLNNGDGHTRNTKESRVLLKRRCLQVMTGPARYDFSHGIRNQDLLSDRRVSLTMRESPLTRGESKSSRSSDQPTIRQIIQKQDEVAHRQHLSK